MPAVFIGHGSPMNALHPNRHTMAWADFAASIDRPRAILAVSAHWHIPTVAVTAMPSPRTIHDFWGFPDELFAVKYPAPGSPELADRVADLLAPEPVIRDTGEWGLDHGTWSVLAHMYPEADVPVVQLSIDSRKSFDEHLALGRALAPLRDEGVLIVASGNMVHNLSLIDWQRDEGGFDWAEDFDRWTREMIGSTPASLIDAVSQPAYSRAVPTDEHFLPAVYVAGVAAALGEPGRVIRGGCTMGSLSMTSWAVG
jgi:4,5-DOPA dioxygenase extradiol